MKHLLFASVIILLITPVSPSFAVNQELPSREEMWKIIQMQQKQIDTLMQKQTQHENKIAKTQAKVEETKATTEKVAKKTESNAQAIDKGLASASPSAGGGAPGWWKRTSIGGYGEIHANKGGTKDEVDAHRFVTFIGHDFNDNMRLFSEIEVEHADEIFLEQAFLEFDLGEMHQAKVGAFLVPVGIVNEKHEPTTFFGVERNPVETNIIPTTWREAGASVDGNTTSGLNYELALHSGLDNGKKTPRTYKPRDGRGKISNQSLKDGAATARLKYTGMPGVELAGSAHYQQDMNQDQALSTAQATLFEAHADIKRGPWGLRALAARWDISGSGAEALGRDMQYGYYIEPSYTFKLPKKAGKAGVFARYNHYDNAAGNSADTDVRQVDLGVNYWPDPDIVLKADVAIIDNGSALTTPDDEIFNFGAGFVF